MAFQSSDAATLCAGGHCKQHRVEACSSRACKRSVARNKPHLFKQHHVENVPRVANLELGCSSLGQEVTTFMLRNIPNRYTQHCLLEELDLAGFGGSYDFFYLPMDVHNRSNVGYAFVNLLTAHDGRLFYQAFSQYSFKRHVSSKIAAVSPAHVQGLVNNLYHFTNRAVTNSKHDEYKPLVFIQGKPQDFLKVLADLAFCIPGRKSPGQFADCDVADALGRQGQIATLSLLAALEPQLDEQPHASVRGEAQDDRVWEMALGKTDCQPSLTAMKDDFEVVPALPLPTVVPSAQLQVLGSQCENFGELADAAAVAQEQPAAKRGKQRAAPLETSASGWPSSLPRSCAVALSSPHSLDALSALSSSEFAAAPSERPVCFLTAEARGSTMVNTEAAAFGVFAVVKRTFLEFVVPSDPPLRRRARSLGN